MVRFVFQICNRKKYDKDRIKSFISFSKNKLSHRAEMQRTQINQYCNGEITRFDAAVLARLCTALDCKIEDILEFVPADKKWVIKVFDGFA